MITGSLKTNYIKKIKMKKQKTDFELLEGKMRLPIHISYLAKYVLKKSLEETQEIIQKGIEQGLFEEVKFKGYYQVKNQKNK